MRRSNGFLNGTENKVGSYSEWLFAKRKECLARVRPICREAANSLEGHFDMLTNQATDFAGGTGHNLNTWKIHNSEMYNACSVEQDISLVVWTQPAESIENQKNPRQPNVTQMNTIKPGVQITRYALIGVCNTSIHLLIVGLLTWFAEFNQMYANVIAYIVASSFSFVMNTRWSFQSRPGARNYARFQLVSLFGLIVNATLGHLGDYFGWHIVVTVFLIGLTVSVISFLLHRSYTFSKWLA